MVIVALLVSTSLAAQDKLEDLKALSLEELMNIRVISISRQPEKLSTVPSAIQVITSEDIRRSGAGTLAEVLRLATNLQVAQVTSHGWAITSRGFNSSPTATGSLANKLLVMIDGRTVYTPLYGGVFWDAQHVLLEDIERIEVVSGPGGTLWGANAVNGVINIITKKASDTEGLYISGAMGTFLKNHAALQYGGKLSEKMHGRAYVQRFERDHTGFKDSTDYNDQWGMIQGGFRMDFQHSQKDKFSFQGDLYDVKEGDTTTSRINGQNLLGTWSHSISENSNLFAKLYFDRTWRHIFSSGFKDELTTWDVDIQHTVSIGDHHQMVYGVGYRMSVDRTNSLFDPADRTMPIYSGFVQDQIELSEHLQLILGMKLEHNVYVGLQFQPSGRFSWRLSEHNLLWAAYSRAVRSPTRFDVEFISAPNPDFESEKVDAYELGYRLSAPGGLQLSAAGYYNRYEDLRSINMNASPPPNFIFGNGQEANAWGLELSGGYQVFGNWRLRGGYTFHEKNIMAVSDVVLESSDEFEAIDPQNQFLVQSILNISKFEVDIICRYTDQLIATGNLPEVPAYFTFDTRLAWSHKALELAVVGRNLWKAQHVEFAILEIPRHVYGRITWRFLTKEKID